MEYTQALHMNVVFVKFDEASVRGPLAEMWGLVAPVVGIILFVT